MAYTKPALRERLKKSIIRGSKGGRAGQWSARKAQLLKHEYEKAGGGYRGSKTKAQKSLTKWSKEKWGTKSGRPSVMGPRATGERYLPEKVRKSLSPAQYRRTSAAKRRGKKQYVPQPRSIVKKIRSLRRSKSPKKSIRRSRKR